MGLAKVHCCATPPFVMVLFGTVYLCLIECAFGIWECVLNLGVVFGKLQKVFTVRKICKVHNV